MVREAALARLTVIGARAVVHLTDLAARTTASAPGRVAALRALEAIGDARAIDVAKRALGDDDKAIAVAAAGLLQRFLTGNRGADVTDALTATALDRGAQEAVRLAALLALEDLERAALEPLWDALATDSSGSVRAHAADARRGRHVEVASDDGPAPLDDPERLRRELSTNGRPVSLPELQRLIDRIRTREESESGAQREAWRRARGAAHVAVAKRGSRLALYDLRESLERSTSPLPVEFMAALSLVGRRDVPGFDCRCACPRRRRQRLVARPFVGCVSRDRPAREAYRTPCGHEEDTETLAPDSPDDVANA